MMFANFSRFSLVYIGHWFEGAKDSKMVMGG